MNSLLSPLEGVNAPVELAASIAIAEGQQRLVSDLTLGLLHKINNVMTSLYFTAEGCEAEIEEDHPVREMLVQLSSTVRNAQQLLNQTADVNSTLGSTDVGYHDLNTLLSHELYLLKMLLPKAAVVDIETASEPVIVRISTAEFRRVLFSLAINARDAAMERPRIRLQVVDAAKVDTDQYSPGYAPVGDTIALVFKDNGEGVNPDIVERLFEPLFTTRTDRLGVGLFQAQQIAQQNDGQIAVRRNAEEGAEFVWFLPRVTE
ncbi:sensor histidine kinase [Verrucomicrobiota bacterium sgz303538]